MAALAGNEDQVADAISLRQPEGLVGIGVSLDANGVLGHRSPPSFGVRHGSLARRVA